MSDLSELQRKFASANESVLKHGLKLIYDLEQAEEYKKRNEWVFNCMNSAIAIGYSAGIRIDPQEPEWPVVFIELPTGQVSWHVPQHEVVWDGHTTEEKYQRIKEFCEQ